jgi:hypothetical protein
VPLEVRTTKVFDDGGDWIPLPLMPGISINLRDFFHCGDSECSSASIKSLSFHVEYFDIC